VRWPRWIALVNHFGSVSLGRRQVVAAEILGGRRVSVRIDSGFAVATSGYLWQEPNPKTATRGEDTDATAGDRG
jgi:hypothetical protein